MLANLGRRIGKMLFSGSCFLCRGEASEILQLGIGADGAGDLVLGGHAALPDDRDVVVFRRFLGHEDHPLDDAAVRCFVDVARVVGVKTVAEFVDRTEVLERVREIGIDFAQGYLLHRPEPIEAVLDIRLEKHRMTGVLNV